MIAQRRFLETFLTALLVLAPMHTLAAQSETKADARKVAAIRQILEVTNAADQLINAIEAGVPAQRAANPRIPAVFWDRFLEHARARRGELLEALVPVYARTFELAELEGLLQFYKSPLGSRLLQVQPALLRESMQSGQAWGGRIGAEIGQQLAKEGVQFQP